MIRFLDAFVLAHTKLRVHKIRTGIAIAIASLLFGLIGAVIIFTQGVFVSVDDFSEEGLNSRTILGITRSGGLVGFNEYEKRDDLAFVLEVENEHKKIVATKQAAAKKYGVEYVAEFEDPSPVGIDPLTKQKVVKDSNLSDTAVQNVANQKRQGEYKPFDINAYLAKYPSATVIQESSHIIPDNGQLSYMKDGKEAHITSNNPYANRDEDTPMLTILEETITKPFISSTDFDVTKGEIPVIVPFSAAQKALGYKKLGADTSTKEQLERLEDVRSKISEVTASFCYRNVASQALLSRVLAQQEEMKYGAVDPAYVKPSVIYTLPDEKSCGPIAIQSDTRTAAQKRYDAQYVLYEKEIGTYLGEPEQHLVTVRGVGISSDMEGSDQWSVANITKSLLSSSLGYGTWVVPAHLFNELPQSARPDAVFKKSPDLSPHETVFYGFETYLVEFSDKEEARQVLGGLGTMQMGDVYVSPFGSGILVVDEFKRLFAQVLLWMFAIVGGVAVIILTGIVGRTVADGRRESSIFRAIGASRLDIGSVYGVFVLLLALRIVLFTALLALAISLTLEVLFWQDATLGARLAYAASDTTKEFHLFSLTSPYLLWIIGSIFAASIIASIIPILLGARRNPIKDMRNE